jgi:GPN-loop GTPase
MADTDPTCIYFIGTAGAGKSTLTGAYKEWTNKQGLDAVLVNLDPGADQLPYTPDVDVRDWVNLREVMRSHGLGPNGAQIAAADMLAHQASKIREAIDGFQSNYVLLDTPGQIELFVFRPAGKYIVDYLFPQSSMVAFALDPMMGRSPSGFVSGLLLALSVQFRLNVPTAHLLTKTDLLTQEELERIQAWRQEPELLEGALLEEDAGQLREFNVDLLRLLNDSGVLPQLLPTSAINFAGLDDLYSQIQQTIAGGDDPLSGIEPSQEKD